MSEPKPWGVGDYVVTVLMFPFQLIGILLLVIGMIGLVYLWRIPSAANRENLDLTFVLLRTLDDHRLDPLDYLLPQDVQWEETDLAKIEVAFPERDRFETVKLAEHRYEHRVLGSEDSIGPPEPTATSTTPHTNIPVDQLKQAREDLEAVYPIEDEDAWNQLRAWGKGLFLLWWVDHQLVRLQQGTEQIDDEGTEEEHLWFAWSRLRTGTPKIQEDWRVLGKLAKQAYPEPADYDAAMAWARTFREHLALLPQITLGEPSSEREEKDLLAKITVTAPPATDWTSWWLLYQHVGLDVPSHDAARDRWLSLFLHEKANAALAWGKEVEHERRASSEPLPPSSDVVALLCAFERLRGLDDYGIRCRKVSSSAIDKDSPGAVLLQMSLVYGFFPNDDIYFVGASDDRLGLFPVDTGSRVALMTFVLLGIRSLLFGLLAQLVLRLGRDPIYLRYRKKRKLFSKAGLLSLLIFLALPLVAWQLALIALPSWLQLLITPERLLSEVYVSVIFAGGLFLCLTQLLAVVLIFFGIDPEKSWLDELISIPIALWVLLHFDNETWSIVSYLAMALIPEVLVRTGLIGPSDEKPTESPRNWGWLKPTLRWGVGAVALWGVVYACSQLPGCFSQKSHQPPRLAGDADRLSIVDGGFYSGHEGGTWSVITLPEGFAPQAQFLSVGEDGAVRLWSYYGEHQVGGFSLGEHPLRAVRIVPNSKFIVTGGKEGIVRQWSLRGGEPVVFEGAPSPIYALEFSPDGQHLVAGCEDGGIRVWNASDRKLLGILEGHGGAVRSLAFDAAGSLASASEDGTVRLWNVTTQKETNKLDAHEGGAFCVRFSPDGKSLASGGKDETIRIWDVATSQEKTKLVGHRGAVLTLEYFPGGINLVSGGEDQRMRFWHIPTSKELGEEDNIYGAVHDLTLYLEGTFVLSADSRGQIGKWMVGSLPKE